MTTVAQRISAIDIEYVELKTFFGVFVNLPEHNPVIIINHQLNVFEQQATINYLIHAALCSCNWQCFFKIECEFLPKHVMQYQALRPQTVLVGNGGGRLN